MKQTEREKILNRLERIKKHTNRYVHPDTQFVTRDIVTELECLEALVLEMPGDNEPQKQAPQKDTTMVGEHGHVGVSRSRQV